MAIAIGTTESESSTGRYLAKSDGTYLLWNRLVYNSKNIHMDTTSYGNWATVSTTTLRSSLYTGVDPSNTLMPFIDTGI